jgi:hypothetical protein
MRTPTLTDFQKQLNQADTASVWRMLRRTQRKLLDGLDRLYLDDLFLEYDPGNKRLQSAVRWGKIMFQRRTELFVAATDELKARGEDLDLVWLP